MFLLTDGVDATNTGDVFATCIQYGAYGDPFACRYHANVTMDLLGTFIPFAGEQDGSYAGTLLPGRHGGPFASVAVFNGTKLGYPSDTTCFEPHGCRSEARAFSADRGVVVGTALVPVAGTGTVIGPPLFETGFVYTPAEGMLRLPDVAGGDAVSAAYAISADGRVIGGAGTTDAGRRALLWVDRAPVLLTDALHAAGASAPPGWTLLDVQAISDNGRVYAGNATNAAGYPEAFRIVFAAVPTPTP
jgi:probable HAF family extracellular repeat protein